MVEFRVMLFDVSAFIERAYIAMKEKWNELRQGHGKTTAE